MRLNKWYIKNFLQQVSCFHVMARKQIAGTDRRRDLY